ncbi:hypothetical protein [Actinomadura violacea]|uniref:Uncharacterized protein n=1 Tax=Actinomadura violacea TaxID=2819934 RepID=A0ABS3RXW7_9ACTN|nr:hypothetical protein [Actinomadura violacea]MBO2461552.1 hypothetical protein [Actinomadura violacea]
MSSPQVRDGLPTADELREALRLLQVPVDANSIGLEQMTPERQVTALLGVLVAWSNAYSMSQNYNADPLSLDEVHMLVSSAEQEVAAGDPVITLNLTEWRLQWAALTIQEIGRGHVESTPAPPIVELLRAAATMVHTWRDAHDNPAVEMDGVAYSATSGKPLLAALEAAETAAAQIRTLLGVQEPPAR